MASEIFMMTSSNGNIFRVTGPLCGELTGHRWIPLTKVCDAELRCILLSAHEQTAEQTIDKPVIWDAIALIMKSLSFDQHWLRLGLVTWRHQAITWNSWVIIRGDLWHTFTEGQFYKKCSICSTPHISLEWSRLPDTNELIDAPKSPYIPGGSYYHDVSMHVFCWNKVYKITHDWQRVKSPSLIDEYIRQ